MNADWFYSAGDTRLGPVTEDALRQLAASGQLKPTDLVWKDGMPDWVEARTVPALFPARRAEPAPEDEDRPSRRRPDDDRPSRRGRRDDTDEMDDDRPRVRRHEDDDRFDDRYDDDRPRRRRNARPGQVQAVGIMMLIGGILGLVNMLIWPLASAGVCCLWPGVYYEIVIGILLLIRGINILNQDDQGPPRTLAILQIICIVNLDVPNCVMGIVSLILLNDPNVQDYYRRRGLA